MSSELRVNVLRGSTANGNITIQGEGASNLGGATMQLQQGLTKLWISYNTVTTVSTYDSLNVSTLTDLGGTGGVVSVTATNVFQTINYAVSAETGLVVAGPCFMNIHTSGAWTTQAPTTSTFALMTTRYDAASILDTEFAAADVKGDLA